MQNLTESTIHIRVPAELKGQWVRESRKAGMKLADWIKTKVNHDPERIKGNAQEGQADTKAGR